MVLVVVGVVSVVVVDAISFAICAYRETSMSVHSHFVRQGGGMCFADGD